MKDMNEENICPNCNEWKGEDYDTCFPCGLSEDESVEDTVSKMSPVTETTLVTKSVAEWDECECGEYKKSTFDLCFMCSKEAKDRIFAKFKS